MNFFNFLVFSLFPSHLCFYWNWTVSWGNCFSSNRIKVVIFLSQILFLRAKQGSGAPPCPTSRFSKHDHLFLLQVPCSSEACVTRLFHHSLTLGFNHSFLMKPSIHSKFQLWLICSESSDNYFLFSPKLTISCHVSLLSSLFSGDFLIHNNVIVAMLMLIEYFLSARLFKQFYLLYTDFTTTFWDTVYCHSHHTNEETQGYLFTSLSPLPSPLKWSSVPLPDSLSPDFGVTQP